MSDLGDAYRAKRAELLQRGVAPYPHAFERTHRAAEILADVLVGAARAGSGRS